MTYLKFMDELPLWAKIVLAIPVFDAFWCVYRLITSIFKKNNVGIALAIVLLVFSWSFVGIFDIICLAVKQRIYWID